MNERINTWMNEWNGQFTLIKCPAWRMFLTICRRSSDPFYIINHYIKWVTTSWTHSILVKVAKGIILYKIVSLVAPLWPDVEWSAIQLGMPIQNVPNFIWRIYMKEKCVKWGECTKINFEHNFKYGSFPIYKLLS